MSRIAKPVSDSGDDFVVVGTVIAGEPRFVIERGGMHWQDISANASERVVHVGHEIVALTEGDEDSDIARIALKTGWFKPTGRVVDFPRNYRNEVWLLTDEALVELGLRPRTAVHSHLLSPSMAATLQVLHEELAKDEVLISATVVTVPNPFLDDDSTDARRRILVAADPDNLRARAALFENEPPERARNGPLAIWLKLSDVAGSSWHAEMLGRGFDHAVSLRIPLFRDHCSEILLFPSMAKPKFDFAQAALMAWKSLNSHFQLKMAAAREICNLTPREQECIELAAEGLTDQEIASRLALAPRTVVMHMAALRNKLRADSRTRAVTTALKMGVL